MEQAIAIPPIMAIRARETNMPPVIPGFWNFPQSEGIPAEIALRIGSDHNDPDGKIVTYEYDFGDGQTTYLTSEDIGAEENQEITISHVYDAIGEYTATVTAIDDRGAQTTASTLVSITNNQRPNPVFSVNIVPNSQNPESYDIQLDSSSSSDPDGDIDHYNWHLRGPNGIRHDYLGNTSTSLTHTVSPEDTGEYIIELWVQDGDDKGHNAEASVYVGVDAPSGGSAPSLVYTIIPIQGDFPFTVSFDASNSFDIDGDSFEVFWFLGNENTSASPWARGETVTHTYQYPGVRDGSVMLRDAHGNTTMSYFSVYVNPPAQAEVKPYILSRMWYGRPLGIAFYVWIAIRVT